MLNLILAAVLAVLGLIPGGDRLMGLPTIGVTIDGADVTSQLQSATWNLGIDNFLADLAPNTASLSFKGQLSVSPADAVVITAGGTAMWTGRLDSYTETRDVNGDYWSSVGATDVIGALGNAQLRNYTVADGSKLHTLTESLASTAGVTIDVVDSSSDGLTSLYTYDYNGGDLLGLVNEAARISNAMMALQHDGTVKVWTREKLAEGFVTNGTFNVNTTGWAATGAGASITRVTASPYEGAGNGRIVTGSTLYGGADYAITGTFKKGHTYRLDYQARSISGSTSIIGGLGAQGASDYNNEGETLTASWAPYLADWTPTADRTSVSAIFRNTAAASNTFEIDSVTVTEIVNATDISASIVTWEKTTSIDVDINRWLAHLAGGGGGTAIDEDDAADIAIYGERAFVADMAWVNVDPFVDWYTYGGSQRPVVTRGELVVSSSASSLLALDPLDWVSDGSDNWQIMSMEWSAVPGEPWRLTITADNLIYLLRGY